ncbi:MAG: hypothetical protein KAX66_02625 [Propionivibrio sp.]|nr:hypothetical protein [Propionivibrio sp.]
MPVVLRPCGKRLDINASARGAELSHPRTERRSGGEEHLRLKHWAAQWGLVPDSLIFMVSSMKQDEMLGHRAERPRDDARPSSALVLLCSADR